MLEKTISLLKGMSDHARESIFSKLSFSAENMETWKAIIKGISLHISDDGIIAQYDGYFDLQELEWDYYREKYKNIYRMDRLLKAEGKSPDAYKVAKQADTLMTFYNLNADTVDGMIRSLGYDLPEGYLRNNLLYYLQRTSHGSTLSRVVHAKLASMVGDADLSWQLYKDALTSDYQDIQGGTTAEGIHAGVMAGTVLGALNTYAGLDLRGDIVKINPRLPDHWKKISFNFAFKGVNYHCDISHERVLLLPDSDVVVEISGLRRDLLIGEQLDMECTI
jgi:trehalose/maltose hydrolase-like predicted phosphorylase